jgi:nucleolin
VLFAICKPSTCRWQDSGRLRGYGHVVFNTTESRNKALKELNGKNLQKRYLNIQEPKSRDGGGGGSVPARTQPEGCRTVFVKNMPYRGITEEDVEHVFRPCGKIVEGGVRLTRNYTTKELKGFGYIEFKNPEGAFAAVQRAAKGGILLKGRNCYVDYEEGAMKGSFRNADGKLWQKKHGSVHEDRDSKKRMKPSF